MVGPLGLAGSALWTYAKQPNLPRKCLRKWRIKCPGQRPFSLKSASVLKSTVICRLNSDPSLITVAWRWRMLLSSGGEFFGLLASIKRVYGFNQPAPGFLFRT